MLAAVSRRPWAPATSKVDDIFEKRQFEGGAPPQFTCRCPTTTWLVAAWDARRAAASRRSCWTCYSQDQFIRDSLTICISRMERSSKRKATNVSPVVNETRVTKRQRTPVSFSYDRSETNEARHLALHDTPVPTHSYLAYPLPTLALSNHYLSS